MSKRSQPKWTNRSVVKFASGTDPISKMERLARETVLSAIDQGWSGPPFDPLRLADILKIQVEPNGGISDARTVPIGKSKVRIEFNPNRPRGRVRFSVAHEIAHTFFEDCAEFVRNRQTGWTPKSDDWQLEMLCNLGAAELVMPVGSLRDHLQYDVTIEELMEIRGSFGVSAEALLIRVAHLLEGPCAAFCASARNSNGDNISYSLDYVIPSSTWPYDFQSGFSVPNDSAITECTAIGFTSRNYEKWSKDVPTLSVESVGLAPYPGSNVTRVAGLLRRRTEPTRGVRKIEYVHRDALESRGSRPKIIAHIVNNRTPNWGGGGFASAVKRKWPEVQNQFRSMVEEGRFSLSIGNSLKIRVDDKLSVVNMVAQFGFGPSPKPRIRYAGLESCLEELARLALEEGASLHMPRIGVGHAGGNWQIIEELIDQKLIANGIDVTIYDLPPNREQAKDDTFLAEFT